jgi:hypothetical protein
VRKTTPESQWLSYSGERRKALDAATSRAFSGKAIEANCRSLIDALRERGFSFEVSIRPNFDQTALLGMFDRFNFRFRLSSPSHGCLRMPVLRKKSPGEAVVRNTGPSSRDYKLPHAG